MYRLYDHNTKWEAVAELHELAEHVADLPLGYYVDEDFDEEIDVAEAVAHDMRMGTNLEAVTRKLAEHDIVLIEEGPVEE